LREKPKQKNNPLVIFLKTGFCFLQEKQKKNIPNCFYGTVQYYHFQNYTMLWHSKLRVKKCTLSLLLQSVVCQFTPSGKAWQAWAQQTGKSLPQPLQFHVKFMCMPCWFSIYSPASSASIECIFFSIWFGMVQHQKEFGYREGRKIGYNILILQS